eukprot:755033-Hanusia_phi.AAC.3
MEDQEIANQFANFFFRTFEKEPKEVGLADDVSLYKLYAPYSARSELICRVGPSVDNQRHAPTMKGVKADGVREIFGLVEAWRVSLSQMLTCTPDRKNCEIGIQIEVFELERANCDMAYYICSDVLQMHENEPKQMSPANVEVAFQQGV